MMGLSMKATFVATILLLGTISSSFASLSRSPSGSELTNSSELIFDGVWTGIGNVTLIKQFDGHVVLQGKDSVSTWSATGVINGNTVICRGHGLTNEGQQFVYESAMTFKEGTLQDTWKVIFSDGKAIEGSDALEKLEVRKPVR